LRTASGLPQAAILILLVANLAGCAGRTTPLPLPSPAASYSPVPSMGLEPAPTPESTGAPEPLLPDLVVATARIAMEKDEGCAGTSTELGTRLVIHNLGEGDAGPFYVEANGARELVATGLEAGGELGLWLPGHAYGDVTAVTVDAPGQVRESDEENNVFSEMVPIPTLPPTCTPTAGVLPTETQSPSPVPAVTDTPAPTATHTPKPPSVSVREEQTAIATYPYASFTSPAWSEAFRTSYIVLDRGAYETTNPAPVNVTYRTVAVENEYLRLTFLPDLGGRLYEVLFKPTGHRETYRNPVLKPSPWGPAEQGWWLAAGGIEWCLPVEEHGYEWGIPWTLETRREGTAVVVTLRDTTAGDRVRASVEVRLEAGAGYFTIRPRLENPTGVPLAVKYWTNAMLAPGGQNAPSAELRFVLPGAVTAVTVHSRGDEWLPGYNQRMSWPVVGGKDLSRLGNWSRWLGFFEDPAVGEFAAVYDEAYDEGMVRVFPADVARGAKVFAFGWRDPISASNWTDDSSSYVELHGGPAATFDDSVTLAAGGHLEWAELWYPVAGIGGLRQANGTAALNLRAGGGQVQIGVAATKRWQGDVVLLLNGQERWRVSTTLTPGQPLWQGVPLGQDVPETGELTLRLIAPGGGVPAQYSAPFRLK
jgi:hypothetical protein